MRVRGFNTSALQNKTDWEIIGEGEKVGKTLLLTIEGKKYAVSPALFRFNADSPSYRVWKAV